MNQIYPCILQWHTFYTAAMTTLMVMPVNLAVIWVFQKVKRKMEMKDGDMEKNVQQYEIKGASRLLQLPRWALWPAWIGK